MPGMQTSASSSLPDLYPAGSVQARAAIFIALAAAIILAIAWAFQLIGDFTPCKLCLEQREGYYTAIPLLMIAALSAVRRRPACLTRGLLVHAGLMFATSMVTGIFQAGAEWGWWLGPNDCGTSGGPTVSAGSLLDELEETTIIFCDEAALRVLGLSFAGWNVIAAAGLMKASLGAAFVPGELSTNDG